MNRQLVVLAAGVAAALITTPILAQRGGGGGPSQACKKEIMNMCGTNRSQIQSCVKANFERLSDRCQRELARRMGIDLDAVKAGAVLPPRATNNADRIVLFGNDERQAIDVFEPEDGWDETPLIIFVQGQDWYTGDLKSVQAKPAHFTRQGMYFASAGYRLRPMATVEDQAKDVGTAVQALVGQSNAIGFDPKRVVLMGDFAGAHLAALVATDPQYAGEYFDAIAGVVLIDGVGLDILAGVEMGEQRDRYKLTDAFGLAPSGQEALSPVNHIGGGDAPNWLALYVEGSALAKAQAEGLVGALSEAGSTATATGITDTDIDRISRHLGTEKGQAQTAAVDTFLAELFGS